MKFLLFLLWLPVAVLAGDNPINQRQSKRVQGKTAFPICDDHTFIRRLWLDTTGRLPKPFEIKRFLEDDSPNKRELAIDRVLDSHQFNSRWIYFLEELFQSSRVASGSFVRNEFHQYLRKQVRADAGWDQITQEILTYSGTIDGDDSKVTFWETPVSFDDFHLDKLDDRTAYITETFLGIQTTCISCHDGKYHLEGINEYLVTKKRKEFWGLAAFLASTARYLPEEYLDIENAEYSFEYVRMVDTDAADFNMGNGILVQRGEGSFNEGEYVAETDAGQGMRPVRSGGLIEPVYMFTGEKPQPGETRRAALARIITADRQFARNMTNRVWAHFFGEGFVNPVNEFDPIRLDSAQAAAAGVKPQPNDPEMLEMMTDQFIAGEYRLRPLIRTILLSDLYQLDYAVLPDPGPERIWPHWGGKRRVRRLEAEAIVDSLFAVMGINPSLIVSTLEYEGVKSSPWNMLDNSDPGGSYRQREFDAEALGFEDDDALLARQLSVREMLNILGRGQRTISLPADTNTSIQTALTMMNQEMINELMLEDSDKSAYLNALIQSFSNGQKTADQVVDELYLRVLVRPPSENERAIAKDHISSNPARIPNLMWALINKPEFIFR